MNIAPGTLKRWRDQLHLLSPSDSALIREQQKMIELMARIVADQAVRLRIMEIALQKNAKPWGGQAGRRGALARGGQGACAVRTDGQGVETGKSLPVCAGSGSFGLVAERDCHGLPGVSPAPDGHEHLALKHPVVRDDRGGFKLGPEGDEGTGD